MRTGDDRKMGERRCGNILPVYSLSIKVRETWHRCRNAAATSTEVEIKHNSA